MYACTFLYTIRASERRHAAARTACVILYSCSYYGADDYSSVKPTAMAGIVAAAVMVRLSSANMYDVVMPTYTADLSSCPHGCLNWAQVPAFVDPATGPFPPTPAAGLFAVGLSACNSSDPAQIWSGDALTNSSVEASTLTTQATPGQCLGTRAHLPMLMDGGEPGRPEFGCQSTWTYNRTLGGTLSIHRGEAGDGRCLDVNSSAPAALSTFMGGGCSATYPGATPGLHPITSGDRWEYLPVGAAASMSGLLQWHCGPTVANGSCPLNRCLAVSRLSAPPVAKLVNASALFAGKLPTGISNSCAMPGAHAGSNECDCGNQAMTYDADFVLSSFAGPWCFCRLPAASPANSLYESPLASYCEPPKGSVPEQINLQLAAWDTAVVGFVTYEQLPTAAPEAILYEQGGGGSAAGLRLSGVSHEFRMPNGTYGRHVLPGRGKKEGEFVNTLNYTNVPYVMSYIKFGNLKPRTNYTYKVRSGSVGAQWSRTIRFRSLYTDGITRVMTYGDMGHTKYNCMENARQGEYDAAASLTFAYVPRASTL